MRKLIMVLPVVFALLAGCAERKENLLTQEALMPGSKMISVPDSELSKRDGSFNAHAIPVTMGDGTRCVALIGRNGSSIDCDWSKSY